MRFYVFLAPISTALFSISSVTGWPAGAAETVSCWMNKSQQTCTIKPWGKGGFEISFSGSAIYRFVPAAPPTTDRRPMRDEQGQIWLMSGHSSFTLEEQSPFRNRISVSNVHSPVGAGNGSHAAYSKVKLNGHGQATVTLYARHNFGASISGMGVSGEVLNKLGCQNSSSLTWCRVGYPNQAPRELWLPSNSLTFLVDGK